MHQLFIKPSCLHLVILRGFAHVHTPCIAAKSPEQQEGLVPSAWPWGAPPCVLGVGLFSEGWLSGKCCWERHVC